MRKQWRRVLFGGLLGLLVLSAAGLGGIWWYFSSLAVAVDHSITYPVVAWPAASGQVTLTRDHETELPGRYGLEWEGGYGTVTTITSSTGGDAAAATLGTAAAVGTVTRSFTSQSGVLTPGVHVLMDSFAYHGDPKSALGLPFREVAIPGELGSFPAWYVPATDEGRGDGGRSWVVFVHGHDSNRQESLRYLSVLHRMGLPVLVVSYRNDVGAPMSPDGVDHLGDTECRDVDAALGWVKQSGARDVVLAGWSMGGAVSLATWDRSPLRGFVRGLVLDSPVIDWREVMTTQGSERGLPTPVTAGALWVMQKRTGIELDRLDWLTRSAELRVPMLVFASRDDTYVGSGPANRLAAKRPDLVHLIDVAGADHTRSWNVDPVAYEQELTRWLTGLGVTTGS